MPSGCKKKPVSKIFQPFFEIVLDFEMHANHKPVFPLWKQALMVLVKSSHQRGRGFDGAAGPVGSNAGEAAPAFRFGLWLTRHACNLMFGL
jgi:hypothetical protein